MSTEFRSAAVLKSFVSSDIAFKAIMSHVKGQKEAVEKMKNNVVHLVKEHVNLVLSLLEKCNKTGEIPEEFRIHNSGNNNYRFQLDYERDNVSVMACVDADCDLVMKLTLDSTATKEITGGICPCVRGDIDIEKVMADALDELYPAESKVMISIEGSFFRFENSYGG